MTLPLHSRAAASAAPLVAAALVSLAACGRAAAPVADTFTWRATLAPGAWVRIRDLNGSVSVARAPGREAVVTATKRSRGRRPEAVRIVAVPDPAGATVCALWGGDGTCSATRYQSTRRTGGWIARLVNRRADVSVDFVVALPPGVRLDASTVNGRVTVADAAGEVQARSVNGRITVAAEHGPVRAETVNGSVTAQVGALADGAGVQLVSTNGSVTAMVPPALAADVELGTVNGSVTSEVPVAASTSDRRSLRGTLGGGGGHRLELRTVNGRVTLRGL